MLVLTKLQGKMTRRGVTFHSRTRKLYRGKFASAVGGGGGQKAPSNEVVPTGPWAPQIPYVNQLFQQASQLYGQGAPKYFPGETVLPQNQLTTDSQNASVNQINQNIPQNNAVAGTASTAAQGAYGNPVASTAQGLTPQMSQSLMALFGGGPSNSLTQAGQSVMPSVTGAIQGATSGSAPQVQAPTLNAGQLDVTGALQGQLNGGMSPYLDQVIQGALRSSTNEFNRNVLPGIGDAASAAGQVGGSRQGIAQGIAAGDLASSQSDIIGRIYQQAFDQSNADRNNAIGVVTNAQGQNAQNQLATSQLNEQIRAALTGESLSGASLGANLMGQGAQLQQSGQLGAAGIGSNLLTQGQSLGTDQLVRSSALLPMLQGANLQGLDFANQLGLQQYGFNQAGLDSQVERYFYDQFAPYNNLTQFQNFISGPYGSSIASSPNQITNQYTGQPAGTIKKPGNNPWGALDSDPVTGLPSPWKW